MSTYCIASEIAKIKKMDAFIQSERRKAIKSSVNAKISLSMIVQADPASAIKQLQIIANCKPINHHEIDAVKRVYFEQAKNEVNDITNYRIQSRLSDRNEELLRDSVNVNKSIKTQALHDNINQKMNSVGKIMDLANDFDHSNRNKSFSTEINNWKNTQLIKGVTAKHRPVYIHGCKSSPLTFVKSLFFKTKTEKILDSIAKTSTRVNKEFIKLVS